MEIHLGHAMSKAERRAEDERIAREKPRQPDLYSPAQVVEKPARRPAFFHRLRRLVTATQSG